MKGRIKNKFFICFKPIVLDPDISESDEISLSATCLTIPNDQNKNSSSKTKSSFQESMTKSITCHHLGRKKAHKAFPRVLRAIFDISLRPSVRDRNLYQLALQSKSNCVRKSGKHLDMKPINQTKSRIGDVRSRLQIGEIGFLMPKSNSFDNSMQSSTPTGKKVMQSPKREILYFIVVTLFFTIFLGRISAVPFTILWLYLKPFRRRD